MITREEIILILRQREARLEKWLDEKPDKKSVLQLKRDFKKWSKDIDDSRELSKVNDPLFPKNSLNSSYTFMNMFGATFATYVVALHYIKKLENELKCKTRKRS